MNCVSCGFEIFHPVGGSELLSLGLYDDARFPGRIIAPLRAHYESYDEVPSALFLSYMEQIAEVTAILKQVLGAARINFAILGNAESHVHAHLIPRYPLFEDLPRKSPWNDLRPLAPLQERAQMEAQLRTAFSERFGKIR